MAESVLDAQYPINVVIRNNEDAHILIFGFLNIRGCNGGKHIHVMEIICLVDGYYSCQPLYLTNSDVPPPPSRLPPPPPTQKNEMSILMQKRNCWYDDFYQTHQSHLDRVEYKIGILDNETNSISVMMNNMLLSLEQQRNEDLATFQTQFNAAITKLCYQFNAQINHQKKEMSKRSEAAQMKNLNRIHELEEQLTRLNIENNKLRRQDKISKILKLQNDDEKEMSEEEIMRKWLLNTVGLPQYTDLLLAEGIDLEIIGDVSMDELEQLGINKLGHRKKIIKHAAKLSATKSPQRLSPSTASSNSVYSHNIWSDVDSLPSVTNNIWTYRQNDL